MHPKAYKSQAQAQYPTHLIAKQTHEHLLRAARVYPQLQVALALLSPQCRALPPRTGVVILRREVRKSSLPFKTSRAPPSYIPPQAIMREIVHIQAGQVWLLA